MRIESNSAAVLQRTRALPGRIQAAHDRAASAPSWQEEARDVALRILQALAKPGEIEAAVQFARTVTSTVFGGNGFALRMRNPLPQLRNILREARSARAASTPQDFMPGSGGLFVKSIVQFEELILEWVSTPEEEGGKRRDARDAGKSDEDIAHLISYIMLSPDLGEKGLYARAALHPHIQEFIEGQHRQAQTIDAETANQWMLAVLAAWREWVRVRYRERVREELRK